MKSYVIHGHGTVQDPNGRLLKPFDAGKSIISFYTNYGSCLTVDTNKLSIAANMHDGAVHYIKRHSNLNPRVVESRIGSYVFTQTNFVPDLWIDTSPSNLKMAGIHRINNDNKSTFHVSRHRKPYLLLSQIVRLLGPAHFHVLSCRAAEDPIHHNNHNILHFSLMKNKKSSSRRRKRKYLNKINKNIPVSLKRLQTRSKTYFKGKSINKK